MSETTSTPRTVTNFATDLLASDTVAIIVKQYLSPDDAENPVIFPPTYLRSRTRNKSQKLEEDSDNAESKKGQQQSVYNIDGPPDGENVCEIDSPQSDGNRCEPLFKSYPLRNLVPQIVIDVNGTPVNLLDAGHRAGDALVRLSSLAAEFHNAFLRADVGDHAPLAALAPTSLLYGAWDSRSTQAKLQRLIKASIRAENVRPLTRSATFIPAVEYVGVGAVKEELDVGEGDSNPLSSEGLKHALASQTLGGVKLTDPKKLVRTIKINLVALRQLRAKIDVPKLCDEATDGEREIYRKAIKEATEVSAARTTALQEYLLGLALVTATTDPDLNLREGCNLRIVDDHFFLVRHRIDDERIKFDRQQVLTFSEDAAKAFFQRMGIDFDNKDRTDAKFEIGVAEEFLGLTDSKGKLSSSERDKVRKLGPITRATLDEYWRQRRKRENAGNPIDRLRTLVNKVRTKNKGKELNADADKLRTYMTDNPADTEELKAIYERIVAVLDGGNPARDKIAALQAVLPPAENQPAPPDDAPIPPASEATE